jgi:hypothetical protein
MTQEREVNAPGKPEPEPEPPAVEPEQDDESFLDSLIESITEIPHWLFRPVFGRKDK